MTFELDDAYVYDYTTDINRYSFLQAKIHSPDEYYTDYTYKIKNLVYKEIPRGTEISYCLIFACGTNKCI